MSGKSYELIVLCSTHTYRYLVECGQNELVDVNDRVEPFVRLMHPDYDEFTVVPLLPGDSVPGSGYTNVREFWGLTYYEVRDPMPAFA